jgi:tetratricopeptide (TPR) repeat protein
VTRRAAVLTLAALALAVAVGAGWWFLRPTAPAILYAAGRDALAAGRWDDGEELAGRLEAAGQADLATLLRGESLLLRGQYAAAIRQLNLVRDTGELRTRAGAFSGLAQFKLGNLREAERVLAYVAEHDPADALGRRILAVIAFDQGNLGTAAARLEEVAALDPADGQALRTLGLIHKDLGRPAEAADAYRRALARRLTDSHRAEATLELAEVLLQQHDYSAALSTLDGKTGATADALAAEALLGKDGPAAARERLEAALSRHPGNARLLRLRGGLRLESGDAPGAVDDLRKAAAADPHDARTLADLGRALEAAGDTAGAADARRRLKVEQDALAELTKLTSEAMERPWDPAPRRKLAEVCRRTGRDELARRWEMAATACEGP